MNKCNKKILIIIFLKLFIIFISFSNDTIDSLLKTANDYYHRNNYSKAIEYYTKVLEIDSEYYEVYYKRGECYFNVKNFEKALSDFVIIHEQSPDFNVIFYNYIEKLYDNENYKGALLYVDNYIEINPNEAKAYYKRLSIYSRLRYTYDNKKYLYDLNKLVKLDPENFKLYKFRGDIYYYYVRDYDKAIKDYEKFLEFDNTNKQIFYSLGTLYNIKEDYEGAIKYYSQITQLDPQDKKAYIEKASAYIKIKKYENALEEINKVVNIDKEYAEAYNTRGLIYYKKEMYDKAIENYNKAIEINLKKSESKRNLGLYYNNRGEAKQAKMLYDEAIEDYDKAIKICMEAKTTIIHQAYYNNACMYFYKENYERASEYVNRAFTYRDGKAFCLRGRIYLERGLNVSAIPDHNKGISLKPDDPDHYLSRGLTYIRFNDIQKALEDFNKSIELKTDYAYYYFLHLYASQKISNEQYNISLKNLNDNKKSFQNKDWETSIADYLNGNIKTEELLNKANNDKRKLCAAYFYIGVNLLFKGNKEEAKNYFLKCTQTNVIDTNEYFLAKIELKNFQ